MAASNGLININRAYILPLFTNLYSERDGEARIGNFVEVDPATVGQYTGLTDKNGKKIFERDICRVCLDPEICTAYVEYDERTASFNLRYNYEQCNTFLDMQLAVNRVGDRVWVEVIGNIHDNPELLEVEA